MYINNYLQLREKAKTLSIISNITESKLIEKDHMMSKNLFLNYAQTIKNKYTSKGISTIKTTYLHHFADKTQTSGSN